jgi:hypothetical protein
MRLLLLAVILNAPCSMFNVSAQIKIGGNVYGGGNQGEVKGSTSVTVYEGNIGVRPENSEEDPDDQNPLADPLGKVFGGARMANVGGNAYVNIDGEHASGYIVINQVYGGNDISGTIGTIETLNAKLPEGERKTLPTEIAGNTDGVDLTWNTYIHLSTKVAKENTTIGNVEIKEGEEMPDAKKIYIGQVFAGGNGDFTYTDEDGTPLKDQNDNYIVMSGDQIIAISKTRFNKPVLQKTYLDVQGGSIVYAYGGGNNATIEEKTVIHVDNPSKVVNNIFVDSDGIEVAEDTEGCFNILTNGRFKDMGINLGFSYPSSGEFQIGSFFGGNNKADMAIRPTWHLQDGKIRNLYSGGNRGRMIYEKGIFLEIPATSTLVVDNLYGGCRMADVRPMRWNGTTYVDVESVSETIGGYAFPDNLAARVIVAGGDVNNVYGGNDVRGKVYFGNAVGIQTSVRGDVYGGGNGSYPYTDNSNLRNSDYYGDLYYDKEGATAAEALLDIRPNAEQVSIQVRGTAEKKTVIGGSIYVGGNCATLKTDESHKNLPNYPLTELKIGSYVIADNVFLGNNGENMVSTNTQEETEGHLTKVEGVLRTFVRTDIATNHSKFSSMDLTKSTDMATYMAGVALSQVPRLIVEEKAKGDRFDYEPYTSYVGSLFYGSNRGSMTYSGRIDIDPVAPIYIYNKLVAGCNNANIPKSEYNARYEGGILGSASEQDNGYVDKNGKIKDRVKMDLSRIRLLPMRLNSTKTGLEWNTYNLNTDGKYVPETLESDISTDTNLPEVILSTGNAESTDISRRLVGGNIYGGCCESGHVNGNVIINLNTSLLNRHDIFDAFEGEEEGDDILYDRESYNITARKSGVILNEQGMDVLGEALSVYGGGKGAETEIWGSATVNIKKGYTFQVFGGSENGVIGKGQWQEGTLNTATNVYEGGKYIYPTEPNDKYSTYVNLNCGREGVSRANDSSEEMADVEFIYGGGNNGLIVGNTHVNLDNGRLFNSFAGSCNADILGHTETYVGQSGFPYLRDHIYGGNDLGGEIKGSADFSNRVSSEETLSMVHATDANNDEVKDVLKANAYVEYRRGRMNYIHGGCFGDYDYDHEFTSAKGYSFPKLGNAFVNFRPDDNNNNHVEKVFGAGEGYPGFHGGDKMQDRSYVLVDIADTKTYYLNTEVFGGGNNNGLGMGFTPDETFAEDFNLDQASAIVDLLRGQIGAAYGGSYNEGVTRRTVLNVPQGSTIKIGSIFGGAYGTQILPPCDVYESNVNYHSSTATLIYDPGNVNYANADPGNPESVSLFNGAIYGGNNNERRTLYARVNIDVPVVQEKVIQYNDEITGMSKGDVLMTNATVYGAGKGEDSWSEYTEVNLMDGAKVYEAYGGGQMGHVLNAASVQQYMQMFKDGPSDRIREVDSDWKNADRWEDVVVEGQTVKKIKAAYEEEWAKDWKAAWVIGDYYEPNDGFNNYIGNAATNLSRVSARPELDDKTASLLAGKKYNTNVIINQGATVVNYAYGGGLGDVKKDQTGDVYGTTYITLLGGTVNKDIYAAGTAGGVCDLFGVGAVSDENLNGFTASANAYIKGGMVRNVYGGGWRGSVGYHNGPISAVANNATDINGESHVVIGDLGDGNFLSGDPAILRNVYGGGEGGGIFGTAMVYVNNGHIGYRYKNNEYVAELDDQEPGDNKLDKSGNVFGGGYVANSYVDHSNIEMYGGTVRGCLYGGGEIGPIGRGTMKTGAPSDGALKNGSAIIYKPGTTRLEMYGGHVLRNVFGGGRGHDNWNSEGYMTKEEQQTMDRSAKGYVFGQTMVHVHGGEIGTESGLAENSGNVFGGGDYGFVYSAYENESGKMCYGKKAGNRFDDANEGYYYKNENGQDVVVSGEKVLTEDCKVLVEPYTKVIRQTKNDSDEDVNVSINGHSYAVGQYVPIDDLNTLGNKKDDAARWNCLDDTGIIIHNAVFAGGNTVQGSIVNANTVTVYGNATASIHDVYHRDLITLGTHHIGGLYGDGNLTLVDGYRGLNITNYGTDYYSIDPEIDIDTYKALPDREAAYYELKYKCLKACTDKDGTRYNPSKEENNVTTKASTINADDLLVLFLENDGTPVRVDEETGNRVPPEEQGGTAVLKQEGGKWVPKADFWEESGVLPIYAGRLMNSIQRADFCGVFGSRMVMRGAQDRVPEVADFTNYTINRVREVSLNQQHSVIPADLTLKTSGSRGDAEDEDPDNYKYLDKAIHGNYFGIYNIVNYLGALTSDVHFRENEDTRRTSNTNDNYQPKTEAEKTYYGWKSTHIKDRKRNNGTSLNKVALASGVYLELTTEKKQGTDLGLYEKDWGYITGVIELDLINVQTGIGGGFVYAKNEHGKPTYLKKNHATLTELNADAITRKDYTYDQDDMKEWETSGNFVHSTQTIIDDCYNISGKYSGTDAVPAHYWYIKGQVYVYDQYISAYTGAPNAYSESVDIPLTITAASHGTMKLLDVMPNRYAFYSSPGVPLGYDKKVNINDIEYFKNDPISYWDWSLLSNTEKELFVEKTYVTNDSCKIGDTYYPSGYVMLPDEYESLMAAAQEHDIDGQTVPAVQKATKDKDGNPVVVKDDNDNIVWKAFDFVFRESNNLRHNTGYILAYKVNNPTGWDTWYTPKLDTDGSKITLAAYKEKSNDDKNKYEDGPTYRLKGSAGAVLGQRNYKVGDLISKDVYDTYQAIPNKPTTGQAVFGDAYLVTKQITEQVVSGGTRHLNPGAAVPDSYATSHSGSVERAYICTSTISLGSSEYIYLDTRMTESEYNAYYNKYITDNPALAAEIKDKVVPAYICTNDENGNLYGGNYYESGKNYRGLEAWSSMSEDDRSKFIFNYDALDLLIDQDYSGVEGKKYQYDGTNEDQAKTNPAGYSVSTPVDYTATYNGTTSLPYITDNESGATATNGTELSRTEYERLVNEQRHYTPITPTKVSNNSSEYKAYVVNTPILIGNSPYAVGQTLTASEYTGLSESYQRYVTELVFNDQGPYYYCREAYTIPSTDEGHPVKSVYGVTGTYAKGASVPLGAVIEGASTTEGYTGYNSLTNNQKNFTIHGISPTETSTLYVSRESDIFDLSTEKIITVIYEYNYEESDTEGNATPVSERHVVNIHINFKSGVPTIEDIKAPQIVLPGDFISMIPPRVSEGAYEVTDYGWELFESPRDAESHTNGIEFTLDGDDADPLYLYQNGHLLAYYAKTYLGKTYSNHVPVSVANYHDLKKVMEAKEHHYYVDDPNVKEAKIYINDYKKVDNQGHETAESANGLDLLKQLFDLSVLDNPTLDNNGIITEGDFAGHKPLSTHVRAARNLAFFLRTDIDHSGSGWSPIGSDNVCDDPSTSADEGVSGKCFDGTLHGDGHTITGLNNSLFAHLCGDVYNLGVTGSFTGAGIADEGLGYVENCWINTTGTPNGSAYAVFGNPIASESTTKQIVNSYYQTGKSYKTVSSDHGVATAKSDQAFYNGEVAYDLNGFYLYKRYNDNAHPEGATTTYKYWLSGNDTPQEGHYAENKALCSSGYNHIKYVEDRFADGDFIYAGGTIPTSDDKRLHTYTVTDQSGNNKIYREYYPIWPDDYLFFGQRLTYGHIQGSTHDDVPTSYANANRVYRAPAYFRSSEMKVAHFNPNAVFAQTKKGDDNVLAYKGMTAIDFTGSNGDVAGGYGLGLHSNKFYPPLLDDGGLTGFTNADLTKNLLVYTGASGGTGSDETPTATQQTANAVGESLKEPDYVESSDGYRTVAYQSPSNLHGHWVENGKATRNHFLVDKEDFNAPIAYTFASDMRMWYQRQPADNEFVDRKKGWQGISLPFTAELVTTHQKGEITHFFSGSYESKNATQTKIGHEYWLREFTGISEKTENNTTIAVANLTYPNSETGNKMDKTVTSTFLWDYYYKGSHNQLDHNKDTYQEYYKASRTYDDYALLSGGTPYLLGLPGVTYYEFDLSGKYVVSTTASPYPAQLTKQTITFVSAVSTDEKPVTINVSDTEMAGVEKTYSVNGKKYTFRPNYLNNPEIATGQVAFLLNSEGNSYVKTDDVIPAVVAFRPFFTSPASGGTRAIVFGNEESELKGEVEHGDPREDSFDGTLNIYAKKDKIYIESQLSYTTDVRVVTPAGITVATATVKPGQTIEVQADFSGMYIVHTLDGKYTKSVIVKK